MLVSYNLSLVFLGFLNKQTKQEINHKEKLHAPLNSAHIKNKTLTSTIKNQIHKTLSIFAITDSNIPYKRKEKKRNLLKIVGISVAGGGLGGHGVLLLLTAATTSFGIAGLLGGVRVRVRGQISIGNGAVGE